ncbi:sigma-70 family RNA polymerase sigma factor [Virgibacillus halodenitrificans]|uniref:sigma-70 family RNA polymerase sigma factor n=1 Tax=Virgibacillus halodenitrificans TaxID=1482 RepID=UPI0024C0A130|nr:sigma-70 family RNA polymerase sigma factor [Virgibacillus halodenitrificans]WHX25650.1 sigma-70 family RNA polymerase sigma factor [Virgibacillus halodenitrificans]
MTRLFNFEEIYEQNKQRIHYQIHRLNIRDPHKEYFQDGLCAMWHANETYDPDKGVLSTYFNYTIRQKLLDQLRKDSKELIHRKSHLQHLHYFQLQQTEDTSEATEILYHLKSRLTENQYIWLYHSILHGMTLEEVADQKDTTIDAVKSWARQARKKLRTEEVRQFILENFY